MNKIRLGLVLSSLMATTAIAHAADPAESYEMAEKASHNKEIIFHLGVGVRTQPRYDGADSYLVYPVPIFRLDYLKLPYLGEVADGEDQTTRGFFFYPTFNVIGERNAGDSNSLTGLRDIDTAYELGLGGGYRYGMFEGFVEVRRGFGGYNGFVGQAGVNAIFDPTDRWNIRTGPRVAFADNNYMDTYFGVTAAEATASPVINSAYEADAGIKSVGIKALSTYDLTKDFRLHLEAGYDRLVLDAADSPIAENGSKDQFTVGVGVTYRFALDLWD
ncbi:MAG: MipA/OmpV family protein [Stappiaceae bacterium]